MKLKLVTLLFFSSVMVCSHATTTHNIIPKPQNITINDGLYTFNGKSTIGFDGSNDKLRNIAAYLNSKIADSYGYVFKFGKSGAVNFELDAKSGLPAEGYQMVVDKKGVTIVASTESGIFYGVQSLLQLMPKEVKSIKRIENIELTVPYCEVKDYPEFVWRGLMLDVSRHWFTVDEVKRYIDQLAEYKMNVFHWHLTDDQGWRIEIKSRPELTAKGALRAERVGQWWQREPQHDGEKATYGGFYTQEQIKEVVGYAAERFVRVIPEIDVPGHSLAALVAYPGLACLKAPTAVNVGNKFYGIDENSLCVGNPESLNFMRDVLREVSALFPDQYIHIGGDECFKGFWAKCPKCNLLMKEKNFTHVDQLQSYFIRQMESILKENGKKLIGWDEISEGGLAPEATVMSWRGVHAGINAAKAGHHVIMTPNNHCYIDLYQGDPTVEPDTYSMCRLSDSYAFEPVPEGVAKEMILGGQGSLWTESVPTMTHAEYMTWPRGWALAEVLWSGSKSKDWNDFIRRVEAHFKRADLANINYAKSMYDVIITPFQNEKKEVMVELTTEIPGLDIYYTFDNTNASPATHKYSSPLTIPEGATWLKVITYRNGELIGKQITYTTKQLIESSAGRKREVGNLNL